MILHFPAYFFLQTDHICYYKKIFNYYESNLIIIRNCSPIEPFITEFLILYYF